MSETVTLAGYDWYAFFIILGLVAVCFIFVCYADNLARLEGIAAFVAGCISFLGIVFAFMLFQNVADDHDHAQRVVAIQNLGYSDITVDGDKFTASDDGIYKSGAFVQVEGDEWIILEAK